MPLQPMTFRKLDDDEASPFGGALAKSIAMRLNQAKMEKSEAEVPYAADLARATAASKLAYSNLMGPQFMAKIMEHPELLANIPEEQKGPLLDWIKSAAVTPGGMGMQQLPKRTPDTLANKIKRMMMGEDESTNQPATQPMVGMPGGTGMPQQQMISNQQPVQNQESLAQPVSNMAMPSQDQGNLTFAQRAGQYKGTIKEIENKMGEVGSAEGKQQAEYGDTYANLSSQEKSLKSLSKSLQNPILADIINTPFINQKSIGFYKQTGTPEVQQALGQLDAEMNTAIADSLSLFPRATNKDLSFLENMKPSDKDLMHVRIGKLQGLLSLNAAKKAQTDLASQYMSKGYSKVQAEKMANSTINMDDVRARIHAEVFPPPVRVRTPRGVLTLPKQGALQLMRDHPDNHEIIEEGTG